MHELCAGSPIVVRFCDCQTLQSRPIGSRGDYAAAAPKRWTASDFLNVLDGRLQDFSQVRDIFHPGRFWTRKTASCESLPVKIELIIRFLNCMVHRLPDLIVA